MKIFCRIVLFVLILFCGLNVQAAVVYNESINGDAPGDDGNEVPSLRLIFGVNFGVLDSGPSSVIGITPGAAGGGDEDWFIFTIAPGDILESIQLTSFVTQDDGGNLGWSNDGTTIFRDHVGPLDPDSPTIYPTPIGSDLLESFAFRDVPDQIPSGTYAIKFGTGTNTNSYSFEFNVESSVVPVPPALLLFVSGVLLLGVAGKKQKF